MYGHIEKMAEEMKKGALAIEGVEVSLFQVNSAPSSRSNLVMFQVFKLLAENHYGEETAY